MVSQSLIDRVPPQDLEAEAAVLGSIILDNEAAAEVVQMLTPDSFYRRGHSIIYDALVHLYDERSGIDLLTLREELSRRGALEDVGGVEYLTDVVESVPSAANVLFYANIVRQKSTLRSLISACTAIVRDAYESAEDVDNLLDRSEKEIFDIAESRVGSDAEPLEDVLKRTMEKIDRYQGRKGSYTGIPSGFPDLDQLTGGFQNSEMIIIAGRPSMGKTTLALNIFKHAAMDEKIPVGVFSMEMSEQMIAQNLLCMEAGIDASRLRSGFLSQEQWTRLGDTLGPLSEAPIYIDDTPGLTILQLRAKARRLVARRKLRMIMVDYIQLMSAPGEQSRQQEISTISRGIKALARELEIPVVALSQLNRSAEAREGHRPRLGDLRESGALEQDADVVVLLHRPDYYRGQAEGEAGSGADETQLIVAKQRNGPTGDVKLTFLKNMLRFESFSVGLPNSAGF